MTYQNFKATDEDLQHLAKPIAEANGTSFPLTIGDAEYLASIEVEEKKGLAYPESKGFWQTAALSQLDGFAKNMIRDQLQGGAVSVTWIEKGVGYIVTARVFQIAPVIGGPKDEIDMSLMTLDPKECIAKLMDGVNKKKRGRPSRTVS